MTVEMSAEHRQGLERVVAGVPGRVSIVIPAYNCADTIGPAIESCLAQDYEDKELIVVDDGSTDRTAAVLTTFGSRVKVITQRNGGLAAARNAGQRVASGEYLAWMDADDLMLPGRIRRQAEVLVSRPTIGLVSSDFTAFKTPDVDLEASHIVSYYDAASRLGGMRNLYPHVLGGLGSGAEPGVVRAGRVYDDLVWGNFVHPPTVMARRAVLEAAGDSDETLKYSSDYELILRMARLTEFAYIDAPLLRYRRSDGQMSRVHAGERMQLEGIRILEKLRRDDPGAYARLNPVIRRRLAESHIAAADEIGATDRVRALGHIYQGLRLKFLAGPAAVAFGRVITTPALLQTIKHALRMVGVRWAIFLCPLMWWPDGLVITSLGVDLL
jgi:glycosyltransferase involved in cell wall biosynthesis